MSPAAMTLRELADAVKAGVLTLEQAHEEMMRRRAQGLDIGTPRTAVQEQASRR